MTKLIKFELKRFRIKDHIRGVAIANGIILVLGVLLSYMVNIGEISQTDLPSTNFLTITVINMLVIATFLVWEAVLIALIIVEEFRNKTISLLFTYPISRKKLIASKLVLILTLTFASMIVSELFQNICVFILSNFFDFISYDIALKEVLSLIVTMIGALFLGMLPLYVGMIQKSTIATIISSLFIASIAVNSQAGVGGIITILPISILLGAIGLCFAIISIRKIIINDLD